METIQDIEQLHHRMQQEHRLVEAHDEKSYILKHPDYEECVVSVELAEAYIKKYRNYLKFGDMPHAPITLVDQDDTKVYAYFADPDQVKADVESQNVQIGDTFKADIMFGEIHNVDVEMIGYKEYQPAGVEFMGGKVMNFHKIILL